MVMESVTVTLLTQDIKVVDQMMANRAPRPGQILLDDAALQRARQLGENVVKGIQNYETVGYLGDPNLGWCPVCHSNLLSLGQPHWNSGGYPIECPVCHCGGDLEKDENGRWKFVIQANGREKSMTDGSGAKDHFFEIGETMGQVLRQPGRDPRAAQEVLDVPPGRDPASRRPGAGRGRRRRVSQRRPQVGCLPFNRSALDNIANP